MKPSADNVSVNKLEAGRRQLLHAITMFFRQDEELAIQTVASAAYRIIRDLKTQRGRDEVGDQLRNALCFAIKDYRNGTLPNIFLEDERFMNDIRVLANRIPICECSEIENFTVLVSADYAREWWRQHNVAPNFLKHADRDADALLSMDTVETLSLLMSAYSAYCDLVGSSVEYEPEGIVLSTFFSVANGWSQHAIDEFRDVAEHLEQLSDDERFMYCRTWLNVMKGECSLEQC